MSSAAKMKAFDVVQTPAPEADIASMSAISAALNRSQAVIELEADGTILTANENFLNALGYELREIQGKHHRMFCEPAYAASPEYLKFWEKLNRGEFDAGEYMRVGKNGKEVWIQASYNPVLDENGDVIKVVKFASDITAQKQKAAETQGQIDALNRVQAVIEFSTDGMILTANENFLKTVGYDLREIQGKHHRMFCDPKHADTLEYRLFWEKLSRGEYDAGEYKRLGRGGREVWINASYNPIFDAKGRVTKVIKYATDITEQKNKTDVYEGKIKAVSKAQAMIEFNLDGTIREANENFLKTLGYSMEEIRGKHHRIFCDPAYASSGEYRAFWDKLNRGDFDSGEYKRISKS
ncbi:MAG: PAS domain S-box protein, partial [Proteobacteria bacterium]